MSGLRDYQKKAKDLIRDEFVKGKKRVLLVMPTGAGKTVVFCDLLKGVVGKGNRGMIVVRGRELVSQASMRLFRESVEHGVLMAGHWNYRPHEKVQVCSIDTLIARGIKPTVDFIVVDEGHLFAPESEAAKLLSAYDAFTVVVTATPYVSGGMGHLVDSFVKPITMQDLVDQGYLVPFRYFAPSEPDLSEVRMVRVGLDKDYKTSDLFGAMTKGQLTGDIIHHWKTIAAGRPTICFAVNLNHSKILVEKFNEHGIAAEHVDAKSTDKERKEAVERLKTGKTKILSNVGILCTGVDIPPVSAIILARPTQSYNLFIQQVGRGTRIHDGKLDCILLDHAGNIRRHGFPTMEPEIDLDGEPQRESHAIQSKICKTCFAIYRGKECPECGAPAPVEKKKIEVQEGELHEIEVKAKHPIQQWLEYLEHQRRKTGKKNGWQYYKLVDKFGFDQSKPFLPDWFIRRFEHKNAETTAVSSIFGYSPYKGR